MNVCEDSHEPKYQITYKSSKRKYKTTFESLTDGKYAPVWLVCESCLKDKECFGSQDEIETIEMLA